MGEAENDGDWESKYEQWIDLEDSQRAHTISSPFIMVKRVNPGPCSFCGTHRHPVAQLCAAAKYFRARAAISLNRDAAFLHNRRTTDPGDATSHPIELLDPTGSPVELYDFDFHI
jgi:hypothetical protein